jgi:colanic acid/amylovoran biosynthesis glycosyltransferase
MNLPTIGFVRHHFLPPSETFIYSSLSALTDFRVRVLTLRRDQAAKFPYADVTVLGGSLRGIAEAALYRATTWAPAANRWARTVELIHAHTGNAGIHAAALARRAGVPLIVSFYGKDVTAAISRTRWNPSYWHYVARQQQLFRRADRILVLSEQMASDLLAQGAPAAKLQKLPLGVDLSRFTSARAERSAEQPLRVLMVGREVEKKGFDDGLRACAVAAAQGARLAITVLGTGGPLRQNLRDLAHHLGLPVAWPAPSTPVAAAMAEHDVLLVPSRTAQNGDKEGTPTVICEGSAAGLAVIATRHAGIPEQVDDGDSGLLAAERDVTRLAQHLIRLGRQPELVRQLGQAGARKMAMNYSMEAHGSKLSAIYREVLALPQRTREFPVRAVPARNHTYI